MGMSLLLAAGAGYTIWKVNKSHKRKVQVRRDTFGISGPNHLISIDWNNKYHRTAVTSSLVKGVSTMQRDKAYKRKRELAKPWWEFFGFSLVETLVDEDDSSIYGAVFEYTKYDSYQNTLHLGRPPRYVIAFRGTMFSSETWESDVKQDLRCFFNNLNQGRRFTHAIQVIQTVLEHTSEKTSVWLAGHSLGAGIALLAGKTMTRKGYPLETYAFNPPNSSVPLEKICDIDVIICPFRIASNFIKVTVASLYDFQIEEDDPRTAAWTPYIYVNPNDIICLEYFRGLNTQNFMCAVAKLISLRSIFFGVKGASSSQPAEPIHFLSSVNMTVMMKESTVFEFTKVHGLKQWWNRALMGYWESHELRPSV